ncbi:MAG: 16S rRNA (guanine(966)-N(2))-methyltransferase RsmD [Elusimicrobiota bacterium]
MSTRVIAGKFKNRNLKTPNGNKIRPISGTIKEALFSILGDKVSGASFADIFAGTGSVGLEALSRGAEEVLFIEKDYSVSKILKDNIKQLQVRESCKVIVTDFFNYRPGNFNPDIVFASPPYKANISGKILEYCAKKKISENNIVIIQHHKKEQITSEYHKLIYSKKYGITSLDFFRLKEST